MIFAEFAGDYFGGKMSEKVEPNGSFDTSTTRPCGRAVLRQPGARPGQHLCPQIEALVTIRCRCKVAYKPL